MKKINLIFNMIKDWEVPDKLVGIAKVRVTGLVHAEAARMMTLVDLLVNAYLLGMADAFETGPPPDHQNRTTEKDNPLKD